MAFVGPHHMPKILGKNHQSTTKVTLNEPPNILLTFSDFATSAEDNSGLVSQISRDKQPIKVCSSFSALSGNTDSGAVFNQMLNVSFILTFFRANVNVMRKVKVVYRPHSEGNTMPPPPPPPPLYGNPHSPTVQGLPPSCLEPHCMGTALHFMILTVWGPPTVHPPPLRYEASWNVRLKDRGDHARGLSCLEIPFVMYNSPCVLFHPEIKMRSQLASYWKTFLFAKS